MAATFDRHIKVDGLSSEVANAAGYSPLNFEYPCIEAKFCEDKYFRREALLAATKSLNKEIPFWLPKHIDTPSVWCANSLQIPEIIRCVLPNGVDEVEAALRKFNASGVDLNCIAPPTFPLPILGPYLRSISKEIHDGKGAIIIKGFDPEKYDLRSNIIIFAGLCSYVGDQRGRQSAQNDVLTHLFSTRDKAIKDPRPGLSNHALPFHNDHCDILALYVIETARAGGATRWSSFGKIYNDIVATKPHIIEVLARNDWPHETPSREVKNLPLMFVDEGVPFLSFTRFALTGLPSYPRGPNTPKLTPEQADALDTIQYLAEKNAVEVKQEKGDIFLVNNRSILHARDKIQDAADESRRHLMRLCLRDSEHGRPIPFNLKRRWGDIFDNNQHKDGRWMMSKEQKASFVSNSKFDEAFPNDETTGSHG